jgi:hypothetical protein
LRERVGQHQSFLLWQVVLGQCRVPGHPWPGRAGRARVAREDGTPGSPRRPLDLGLHHC